MRLAVAVAAAIASTAAHADACRLSTADCHVIAEEVAAEEVAQISDERHFGTSMRSCDRAIKFVDIEADSEGKPKQVKQSDAPPVAREPDAEALNQSVDPELSHP